MWVYVLHACLCTIWVSRAHKCQKASDTLELELQVVVSRHVGARNPRWVLGRSSQHSSLLSQPSSPAWILIKCEIIREWWLLRTWYGLFNCKFL